LGNGVIHLISERGEQIFNQRLFCLQCGIGYEPLDPRLFSFNSRQGACAQCAGMGFQWDFDPELIFADPGKSVRETLNVIAESFSQNAAHLSRAMERLSEKLEGHVEMDKPFGRLAKKTQEEILNGGSGRNAARGIIPFLRELWGDGEDEANQELAELLAETPCSACQGLRLNPRAQAVRIDGKAISQVTAFSVESAKEYFAAWQPGQSANGDSERDRAVADKIVREIQQRLSFLAEVGLPYLTLDRRADTLSGGEAQRIRLASQLGSNLRGVCYILDEPTIGLHPRDNRILLDTLAKLEAKGNTLVVVEHDEDTIRRADHIIDIGPSAGKRGGRVVAQGSASDVSAVAESVTGRYLMHAMKHPVKPRREVTASLASPLLGSAHVPFGQGRHLSGWGRSTGSGEEGERNQARDHGPGLPFWGGARVCTRSRKRGSARSRSKLGSRSTCAGSSMPREKASASCFSASSSRPAAAAATARP
jgi:excinuclease ABC subunit A